MTIIIASYSKKILKLRVNLMVNNWLGILSGLASGSPPTFIKHVINLPINIIRYREMRKLIENVDRVSGANINFEWLRPFMHSRAFNAGDIIFTKGQKADVAYILVDGQLEVVERNVNLSPGEIFGELVLFTGSRVRTASTKCNTDVRVLFIRYADLEQLYFENPGFGLHLIKLVVRRSEATRPALENGY